ncbi:MAG: hypothetical protein L6Q99_02970 [Planctomycetes bacterium]|nr:hypothetical protein [Planctomycetota bacterium]
MLVRRPRLVALRCVTSVPLVLCATVGAALAKHPHYTITNVSDALGGTAFGLAGISDTGYVTGWVDLAGSGTGSVGFRWSARGIATPEPPVGDPWLTFNTVDVNDSGVTVGWFGTSSPSWMSRGFRWQSGAALELVNPLGWNAFPTAINAAGWAVGYSGFQVGVSPGAVVWDPAGTPSFVADLRQAFDINSSGQIVGYRPDANGVARAFLYDQGVLTPLGTLDPQAQGDVYPRAINDHGAVVGTSRIHGEEHAFRWTAATGMVELPDLGVSAFPFNVAALDVNDAGWIVGYAPNGTTQAAVVWAPDGTIAELAPRIPDAGPGTSWPFFIDASRINAAGQLVGFSPNGPSNQETRTILLTPTTLTASTVTPGVAGTVNTLGLDGAAPGKVAFLAAAVDDPFDRGYTTLASCEPLGLAMEAPRIVATAVADAAGHATFEWTVPAAFAGSTLRFQAFQRGSCALSNVVRAAL